MESLRRIPGTSRSRVLLQTSSRTDHPLARAVQARRGEAPNTKHLHLYEVHVAYRGEKTATFQEVCTASYTILVRTIPAHSGL